MVPWIQSPTWTILIWLWKRALPRWEKRDRKKTKEGGRKEVRKKGREEKLLITIVIEKTSDGLNKTPRVSSAYSHLYVNTGLYASKWTTEKNHRKAWDIRVCFFKGWTFCNDLPDSLRVWFQDANLGPWLGRQLSDSIQILLQGRAKKGRGEKLT